MSKIPNASGAQPNDAIVIEDLQGMTRKQLDLLLDHLGGETSLSELGKTLQGIADRYTTCYLHTLDSDLDVGEILVPPLVHYEDRYALQTLIDIANTI